MGCKTPLSCGLLRVTNILQMDCEMFHFGVKHEIFGNFDVALIVTIDGYWRGVWHVKFREQILKSFCLFKYFHKSLIFWLCWWQGYMDFCFLLLQVIGVLPILKIKLLLEFLVSRSPPQSTSLKLVSFNLSPLLYIDLKSAYPLWYLRMVLIVLKWVFCGCYMYFLTHWL